MTPIEERPSFRAPLTVQSVSRSSTDFLLILSNQWVHRTGGSEADLSEANRCRAKASRPRLARPAAGGLFWPGSHREISPADTGLSTGSPARSSPIIRGPNRLTPLRSNYRATMLV